MSKDCHITHPTSTARTAPLPLYVPVWHNGPLPPSYPSITYLPPPIYQQPSPHYRPHTVTYLDLIPPSQPSDGEPIDVSKNSPSSETTTSDLTTAVLPGITDNHNDIEPGGLSTEKELTADDVVAVLEAALRQAASQSNSGSDVDYNGNDQEHRISPVNSIGAELDHQMEEELMELCVLSDYGDTMLNSGKLHIMRVFTAFYFFQR